MAAYIISGKDYTFTHFKLSFLNFSHVWTLTSSRRHARYDLHYVGLENKSCDIAGCDSEE